MVILQSKLASINQSLPQVALGLDTVKADLQDSDDALQAIGDLHAWDFQSLAPCLLEVGELRYLLACRTNGPVSAQALALLFDEKEACATSSSNIKKNCRHKWANAGHVPVIERTVHPNFPSQAPRTQCRVLPIVLHKPHIMLLSVDAQGLQAAQIQLLWVAWIRLQNDLQICTFVFEISLNVQPFSYARLDILSNVFGVVMAPRLATDLQ